MKKLSILFFTLMIFCGVNAALAKVSRVNQVSARAIQAQLQKEQGKTLNYEILGSSDSPRSQTLPFMNHKTTKIAKATARTSDSNTVYTEIASLQIDQAPNFGCSWLYIDCTNGIFLMLDVNCVPFEYGTYTIEDLVGNSLDEKQVNSFGFDGLGNMLMIESLSMVYAFDPVSSTKTLDIEFGTTDGINYILTYAEKLQEEYNYTDTIDVVIPDAKLTLYSGAWQLRGYSEDHTAFASIGIFSDYVEGVLSSESMYSDYTYVLFEPNSFLPGISLSGNVVVTENGYQADAFIGSDNACCYHVSMTYIEPVAFDEDVFFDDYISKHKVSATFNMWECVFQEDANNYYTFNIYLPDNLSFPEDGITYHFSDMQTYITNKTKDGVEVRCSDAEFTYTANYHGTNREYIEAKMTCEDGGTYHIFYLEPEKPSEFREIELTIDGSVTLIDRRSDLVSFQFGQIADDNSIRAFFAINSKDIIGEFTKNDLYGDLNRSMTFITIDNQKARLCDFTASISAGEKEGDYVVLANYYTYNGEKYVVKMNYVLPEIHETIEINATNLTVMMISEMGFIMGFEVTATTDDYSVYAFLPNIPCENYPGAVMITRNDQNTSEDLFSSMITVEEGGERSYGYALTKNGTLYNFNLVLEIPEPTDIINFVGDVKNPESVYYNLGSAMQILAIDDPMKHYISIAIYSNSLEGTFTLDEIEPFYTYVGVLDDDIQYLEDIYSFYTLDVTTSLNEDGTMNVSAQGIARSQIYTDQWPFINIEINNLRNADDPVAISEIKQNGNSEVYTIQGQKVTTQLQTLGAGLYITDGKKVIKKQ